MDSTRERAIAAWMPRVPYAAVGTLLLGAGVVALRFGAPAVVLWFAFAALAAGILLFWESVRTALDPNAVGDDEPVERTDEWRKDLEEKKRVAVTALRDLDFEHSIHRIADDDYEAMTTRYRGEARAAMEALDEGLGPYLGKAEELIARASDESSPEATPRNRKKAKRDEPIDDPVATEARDTATSEVGTRACSSCNAANDADAVFCKKCGVRFE